MADATLAFNILTKYKDTGVRAATKDMARLDNSVGRSSSTFSKFGGIALKAGGLLGGIGFAAAIKGSIGLEAKFGQTMATIQAATGASTGEMKKFNDLAIKLGANTSFSAGEAADAMLELAKAGLSTSTIMGGGVAGTLTLAAAGGTDLSTAATIASNALNTFNLKGKDMASVAAALAGGANASSASVESLGLGLQQVGPGAINAGLSIQETVAALAAFDNAGIKGQDAGTSLKTMLSRLVPTTKKAADEMKDLGLKFTDNQGRFKSLGNISEQLRDKMGKLSQEERSRAMTTIFGSDATRAATVLMHEGRKGITGYIKATSDQTAAQKMANARMAGTAGALERLKGSVQTVALRFGQEMAPAVQTVANWLAEHLVPAAEKTITAIKSVAGFVNEHRTAMTALAVTIGALVVITRIHAAVMAVDAAGGMLKYLQATKLVTAATKTYAAVQWLLNAALTANPIGLVIVGIAALVAALVVAYKKSETFRRIVDGAFRAVKAAAEFAFGWVKKNWPLILGILTGPIGLAVVAIVRNWDKIKTATSAAWNTIVDFIKSIPSKIVAVFMNFSLPGLMLKHWQAIHDGATNMWGRLIDYIKGIPRRIVSGLGNLGSLLWDAGTQIIQGLIDGIASKVGALVDKLHDITKMIPIHKGPRNKDRILLKPAGVAIMEGLIDGIDSQKQRLSKVLDKLTNFIQEQGAKIRDLMSQKRDIASSFASSFGATVFGSDAKDISSILKLAHQQASQAYQLKSKIAKLIKKGVSENVLQQLAASGPEGVAQINALAGANHAEIVDFNKATASAAASLNSAGNMVGGSLLNDDIAAAKREQRAAQAIAHELRKLLHEQDKNTVVQLVIDGKVLRWSLLQLKRNNGGKALGIA